MIRFLLLAIFVLLGLSTSTQTSWYITPESHINIYGSSNITAFECDMASLKSSDTLRVIHDSQGYLISGTVHIETAAFKCETRLATKEFQRTLKYKSHPFITMEFDKRNTALSGPDLSIYDIVLNIVDNDHTYPVQMSAMKDDMGRLKISALQPIKFSHFDIDPPSKLAGLIRVHDELEVEVNLILAEVPQP